MPGEVKMGRAGKQRFIATVEPYHGNNFTIYTEPRKKGGLWTKQVADTQIFDGHGLGWADFDGDGQEELAAGWRGNPTVGVVVYKRDPAGEWKRIAFVDDGGMACEDLVVADLDGDQRPEIIAGGRRTRNVRIYWNQMAKR
jgi:hypothetical protein